MQSLLDKFGPLAGAAEAAALAAPAQQQGPDALSGRELQVMRLLGLGLRNKAIADKLFLSERTIKAHPRNINAKLGAQGRTEALAIARSRGLIDEVRRHATATIDARSRGSKTRCAPRHARI